MSRLQEHIQTCVAKTASTDQYSTVEFTIKKENLDKLEELANSSVEVDDGFLCLNCPKTFKTKGQLKAHLSVHTGLYSYMCTRCSKGFNAKTRLKAHMNEHDQIYPFCCETCQKKFTSERRLREHMKRMVGKPSHGKKNTFRCTLCGQGYLYKSNLMKHEKTQHGRELDISEAKVGGGEIKAVPMPSSKNAKGNRNVKEKTSYGQRMESSDTSSQQPQLGHGFDSTGSSRSRSSQESTTPSTSSSRSSNSTPFSSAESKISSGLPRVELYKLHPYACSKCSSVFQTRSLLEKHVSIKHPVQERKRNVEKGKSDGNTYRSKGKKKSHSKKKRRVSRLEDEEEDYIECAVCQKRYIELKKYKKHLKSHKDYFHFCSHCPKVFESRRHLSKHVSYRHPMWQQPWCDVCRKSFTSEYNYKLHMKWHVSNSFAYD